MTKWYKEQSSNMSLRNLLETQPQHLSKSHRSVLFSGWNVLPITTKAKKFNFKAPTPNWQQKVETATRTPVSSPTAQPVRSERQQVISECCHLSLSAAKTSLRWRETHLSHTLATHSVLCQRTLRAQTTPSKRHTHQGLPLESMCSVSDRIEWNLIENAPRPTPKKKEEGGSEGEKKARDSKCETESEWTIQRSHRKINESVNSSLCWGKRTLVFEGW